MTIQYVKKRLLEMGSLYVPKCTVHLYYDTWSISFIFNKMIEIKLRDELDDLGGLNCVIKTVHIAEGDQKIEMNIIRGCPLDEVAELLSGYIQEWEYQVNIISHELQET